jgi:branched-chain amino acid transport system substrate-binding protein
MTWMKRSGRWIGSLAAVGVGLSLIFAPACAETKYDPGASDTEIKIGNIVPYTGVFSEYGANGRAEAAYFQMINDQGGIHGRKITFISLDSGPDAANPLPLAQMLVENQQVLLMFGTWGAPANLAIRSYLNEKKVPQLFVADTDAAMDDPAHFPWTMGFQPDKRTEGAAYAKYILQNRPDAKIAILCGNAPTDQEWVEGMHAALGGTTAKMIVKEIAFAYGDPAALDPQIDELKKSGADVFMNLGVGKYATEAIRDAYDIDWHPLQFIPNAAISISSFLDPAGLEKARGIICNARSKSWAKSNWDDPAVRAYIDWFHKYLPDGNLRDANNVYGYEVAQALVEVLTRCGDELTRDNVMKQATSLDLKLGMLRPGVKITTSPTDYRPIKQLFLVQFDGRSWVPFGGVVGD